MLFSWSQKEWPDSFHFFFFFFFRMKISSFEHYPVASCKLIIYFFSHPRSSSVAGWAIGCFDAIAHTRAVARNYVAKRILLQFAQKKKSKSALHLCVLTFQRFFGLCDRASKRAPQCTSVFLGGETISKDGDEGGFADSDCICQFTLARLTKIPIVDCVERDRARESDRF